MSEKSNHQGATYSRVFPSAKLRYKQEDRVVLYSIDIDLSSLFDDTIFNFIVKLLYWFSFISDAQKRYNVFEGWVNTFFNFFSFEDDGTEERPVFSKAYDKREVNYFALFDDNLSSYSHYSLDAVAHHFSTKLRNAFASIPSQAEVLHGATCSNAFCTYII